MFQRFPNNPLLNPASAIPTRPDLAVEAILNPGAFRFNGRIGLLVRVAERPLQEPGWLSTPILDPSSETGIRVLRLRVDDPDLISTDPRGFTYQGRAYLTTLSHLRLAWSDDGISFSLDKKPLLLGEGPLESFGIEDVRVELFEDRYWLTYSAVSEFGVGVGLISTPDWQSFERHGLILPPHNKDCSLFPGRLGSHYWAMHRPSGVGPGGHFIWVAQSPDLLHWGGHACVATTRPGRWDSERIGGGAAPIRTDQGWLAIYHGADDNSRYCLGALLLDLDDPRRVLARSREPIMEPVAEYEKFGFFGHVVFTNGHVTDGDDILLYYGASDTVTCGARGRISDILASLR